MGQISQFLDKVIANSAFGLEDVVLCDQLAWLNDSPDSTLEGYRPGWDVEGYAPTPEEAAEVLGWELGLAGEPRPEDRGYTLAPPEFLAMFRGWIHGNHQREERERREEAEYGAWLEELGREREAELMLEDGRAWHEAERVEAAGVIESRKG